MRALDLALEHILPPDLQQPNGYDFGKKGLSRLTSDIARRYPDRYGEIVKQLGDLGRHHAWHSGFSFGDADLRTGVDVNAHLERMDAELDHLRKQQKDQQITPEEFKTQRAAILTSYSDRLNDEVMQDGLKRGNGFAQAVASGARGNPGHLKAILATPGVYADAKGNVVPLFVRHSFAEGLRPAESLAGTYGARNSVVSTKKATAKGGDLLKQLNHSTSHYNITEHDCGTHNGLALDPDDPSLRGRVLAREAAGHKAGTVIDRQVAADLRRADLPVLARSPLTCHSVGGLCAKCSGIDLGGHLPRVGTAVSMTSAAAVGEPIVQGALNVKHLGGAAKGKKTFSGFDAISQFVQAPEEFKDRAAVAEHDGTVDKIEDAPQGGKIITVNGLKHLALPGFEPTVKPGDKVEAGDILSEGLANPADIVRLRGLGEGRKYYADRLERILTDSDQKPDRRNVERIAKSAIDNYLVTDPSEHSDYNPDDLVREGEFLKQYQPPKDTIHGPAANGIGQFLQAPVLHYTLGTRITPRIAAHIDQTQLHASYSRETPGFDPYMTRLRTNSHSSRDWMVNLSTSYLGRNMQNATEGAHDTNVDANHHFAPRLMQGEAFGKKIEQTGKF